MIRGKSRPLFRDSAVSVMVLMAILALPLSHSFTAEQDVFAINSLYVALGSPLLPGWIPNGGDPCLEAWQGIRCVGPNITSIIMNSANLGGQLGDQLGKFSSIVTIDFSNNFIGGVIPENLPLTLRGLYALKFKASFFQYSSQFIDVCGTFIFILIRILNSLTMQFSFRQSFYRNYPKFFVRINISF